jgi:hypothetical protein
MARGFEFEVQAGSGPPPGTYKAVLTAIESTTHPEYGEGLRFSWQIAEGMSAGLLAARTCNPHPTPTNATGRLMAGLLGRQIKPGEKVSLAGCIGRNYMVVVGMGRNGQSTRVESCVPLT